MQDAARAYDRGDWRTAESRCRALLRSDPGHYEALYMLGVIALNTNRAAEACELLGRAVEARPGEANAHANLGIALRLLNRPVESLASYERALEIQPRFAEVHHNRGNLLLQLRRWEDALSSYDRAVDINPVYAEAHNNRGLALRELGQRESALASHETALRIRSDYAAAHSNRGVLLHELQRFEEALGTFDSALRFAPRAAEIHANRGNALKALGRWDEAAESYEVALRLDPNAPAALCSYGNVLSEQKRLAEAADCYQRALRIAPDTEWLFGIWLYTKLQLCEWTQLESRLQELAMRIQAGKAAAPPFAVVALLDSPALQYRAAQIWVNRNCPEPTVVPRITHRRHDRIRVGYFSSDFREHAVSRLIAGVIESHDRSRFDVRAFSFGPDTHDDMRLRMTSAFESFIDVRGRSDRDIAAMARELHIDIAVDLGGFSEGGRPGIFAHRAAPLQVGYLGYLGTMGAPFMDYLFADASIVGPQDRQYYAEKIAYLPCYQANDPRRAVSPGCLTRADVGLPPTGFVFCCFNATYKIAPATFDSWMRILHRVQGSVLFLLGESKIVQDNLRREARHRGIDPGRLVFGGRLPVADYLARYAVADLFLDTLPYNAGTTASDALWAGLPVLTCTGSSFAARVATSIVDAISLPDLITTTSGEYEAVAVELALRPNLHASIREKLREQRRTKALFDAVSCARHIEDAYSRMYERHLAGLPPDHLSSDASQHG